MVSALRLGAILSLCLANTALATIYVTNPVAGTQATGGQTLSVEWADDGASPKVGDIGPCSIDIFTGSVTQQTWLQNMAESVDVSKTSSIMTTIDPTIGQSGKYYFVRFTSKGLKDPKNPQFPYESFSAIFTINSMTGTFNSTVLAQIKGAGAASSSAPASPTVTVNKNVAASSGSSSSASAKPSGAAGQSFTSSTSLIVSFLGMATYLVL